MRQGNPVSSTAPEVVTSGLKIRTAGLVLIHGVTIRSTALPFLPGHREMKRDDSVSAAASEIVTG